MRSGLAVPSPGVSSLDRAWVRKGLFSETRLPADFWYVSSIRQMYSPGVSHMIFASARSLHSRKATKDFPAAVERRNASLPVRESMPFVT